MIINHDFHLHTKISLCAKPEATLDLYLRKASECGLKKIAITDHLWDHNIDGWPKWYGVQHFDRIKTIRPAIDEHNKTGGVKVLFGAEAEYSYSNRRPAISPEVAEQLDMLLVPNSHTHITMPKDFYEPHEKHMQYMIDAFWDIINSDVAKYITAIPHPFMAVGCPYGSGTLIEHTDDDVFKRCFSAAAEKGIGLELNPNYIRKETLAEAFEDPIFRMLRIGKECGCKFTVGSDAHNEADYDNFDKIYVISEILELKEDDFHPLTR